MKLGASTQSVKEQLKKLGERVREHDKAVTKASAENADSVLVQDYKKAWLEFAAKLAAETENADSWTSVVLESTVQNLNAEFAILLTKYATLSNNLTMEKGKKKIEALEFVVEKAGKVPITKEPYRTDHQANLKTEAKPLDLNNGPDDLVKKVVPVVVIGGMLGLILWVGGIVVKTVMRRLLP